MASAAAVSLRSTAPWFPRAIRKTRGTSQWPSVGRAAAPPFALRGPRRHGHKTSQLQFSRYSPSIRHASGIVVSYPRPRGAGSVRGRDCRCAPARVSTASVTGLASSRDGPHPRRALPDDPAASGARRARRGRARARVGLVSGPRAGLRGRALLVVPALARATPPLLARCFRAAKVEGHGAAFRSGLRAGAAPVALVPALALVWAGLGVAGLLGAGAALVAALALAVFMTARLAGVTGDVLGAAIEVAELAGLLTVSAWAHARP